MMASQHSLVARCYADLRSHAAQVYDTQTGKEAVREGHTALQFITVPPSCVSAVKSLPLYILPRVLLPGTVLTSVPSADEHQIVARKLKFVVLQQTGLNIMPQIPAQSMSRHRTVHVHTLCRGK